MLTNLIEQARRFWTGRNAHKSDFIWHGQLGWMCPQLGIYDYVWGKNTAMDAGINYMFNAAFRNGEGLVPGFFLAPFAADATPTGSLTAANFNTTLTEFTNYDETARQAWTTDGASTSKQLFNGNSPATITIGSGLQTSIYGAVLHTSSVKSGTSGIVIAGARGPAPLLNLAQGFEVKMKYRITGSSS